mmetsp:Transcript_20780/g.34360  ORF Transcript_20780/g.34360 Transcript_20780/m.34360 type:complete len:587 (-) Transcript_20780:280-2040(-)
MLRIRSLSGHVHRQPTMVSTLDKLKCRLDNSLMRDLDCDPEQDAKFPNRETRPVRSGHFVKFKTTPLNKPFLVSYSKDMVKELGLDDEEVKSEEFVKVFSADTHGLETWATPYAVSVFGSPIPSPCQFGGYAYGDGRAGSIGEFGSAVGNNKWELQLKGCGPSPFSRSFDGRAVLRSSVREFLVSEAMHHLGVPTTRALCIVGSEDFVDRAWYKRNTFSGKRDYPPNHMIRERCAITTRAAPSFLRVGQVELFSRRMSAGDQNSGPAFEAFLKHALKREFPSIYKDLNEDNLPECILKMLHEFAKSHAQLSCDWIRVGYVQGNMNSDNCLLSGRTMDYGPFGFMESYDPLWTPFTSDPDKKFSFERQPLAANVNVATLVEAVMPILEQGGKETVASGAEVVRKYGNYLLEKRNLMRRSKLGLSYWEEEMDTDLWEPIYSFLTGLDYTIFWRQLGTYTREMLAETDEEKLVAPLVPALDGDRFCPKRRALLVEWLRKWDSYISKCQHTEEDRRKKMNNSNPKYIPREWMLVQAYEAAENRDYTALETLKELFLTPYEEHMDVHDKFYRTTPLEYQRKAGVSFFSCSS